MTNPVTVPNNYPGVFKQCRDELAECLLNWDYSQAFTVLNPSYAASKQDVEIVTQWPDARIDELQSESKDGTLSVPIISLVLSHSSDGPRSLGSNSELPTSSPPAAGMQRIATRVALAILVSCWADLQLGGYEMVEALAGHVQACVFANHRALSTFRHLRVHNSNSAYQDRPGVVTVDLIVEGDARVSIDIPASQ